MTAPTDALRAECEKALREAVRTTKCDIHGRKLCRYEDCVVTTVARAASAQLAQREVELEALREALRDLIEREDPSNILIEYDRIAESFFRETGLFAPGKSIPPAMGLVYTADEEAARSLKWRGFVNGWHEENFNQARAALKETKS